MTSPLYILLVEDSETDAKLVEHALRRGGHDIVSERVEEPGPLIEALVRRPWDLVISDWTLPRLGGRQALSIVRAAQPDVPFIIVSGTVGEQNAVDAMRAGAQDYVLKGNLTRLPQAVSRELRETAIRAAHRRTQEALRENEERTRLLLDSCAEGIYGIDLQGNCTLANASCVRMLGYENEREFLGKNMHRLIHHSRRDGTPYPLEECPIYQSGLHGEGAVLDDEVLWRKDDTRFSAELHSFPLRRGAERVGAVVSFVDITARKKAEEEMRRSEERFKRLSESGMIGIVILDLMGTVLEANDTFLKMVGLERARLEQGNVNVMDVAARESRSSTVAFLQAMATKAAPALFEKEYVRPDGTRVPVLVAPTMLDDNRILSFVLDLSERKRLEQVSREAFELEQQNRRMQEANRLKSEFLANMSHELRTPLNAVIGFGELLYDGLVPTDSPKHREYLGDIVRSGRHLLRLINDVLDLAKVEAGKLDFRPVPLDLELTVNEVISIARGIAAEKRIRVEAHIDPELKEGIELDPVRLKQILYNFISNALKFTPERGWVNVRARPYGADKFLLEVEDTGIGIEPQDIERLFVEFQQLQAGTEKKHSGTGLGLALTRRLVEAQGGSVGVESVPGKGSVFHAILPRRSAAK